MQHYVVCRCAVLLLPLMRHTLLLPLIQRLPYLACMQHSGCCCVHLALANMRAVAVLTIMETPFAQHCNVKSIAGATWAALEYPDADVRCISFGSPRVANKAFGRAFSALVGTSLRLVHGFDPVPALPPSMM